MAKKFLIAAGALAALVLAGALSLRILISPEKLRPVLQARLEEALHRKVEIGNASLSLWPLGLGVERLSVADDARVRSGRPFATAESLLVRARLLPLLRGNVEIESLHLRKPAVELVQLAPGAWNYETLGAGGGEGASGTVSLGAIEVAGMDLGVTKAGSPRTLYSGIDLSVGAFTEGRPIPVRFSALHGELTGAATLTAPPAPAPKSLDASLRMGSVRLLAKGTLTPREGGTALAIDVTIPKAGITELAAAAAKVGLAFSPGMNVKGSLGGTVAVRGTAGAPALSGKAELTGLDVSGGQLREPVRGSTIQLEFTPSVIRSQPFAIATGGTKVSGFFLVSNYSAATPRLDATVWAEDADLGGLVRMAQAYGVSAAQDMTAAGDGGFHVRVHGLLSAGAPLQVSGSINSRKAELRTSPSAQPIQIEQAAIKFNGGTGTGDIAMARLVSEPFPLTNLSASLSMRKGVATLDPVRATLYDGQFEGVITADTNLTPTRVEVRSKMERVDSERLIAAATPLRKVLTGALFSNADLRFSPGPGKDDLAKSLNGTMSLKLDNGKLLAMSVLGEVGKVAQFLNKSNPVQGQVTPFLGLTGDIRLTGGVASTDNLALNLDVGTVAVSGTMNLVNESLNLKMVTTLSRAYTEQMGGTRVGGYLTAAVVNQKGEMVVPTLISGTFSAPRVMPDAAAMAKLKVQQIIPGLAKPGALNEGLGGVLDLFKGEKKEQK